MLDPKIYTLLKLEELGSYTHAAQALSLLALGDVHEQNHRACHLPGGDDGICKHLPARLVDGEKQLCVRAGERGIHGVKNFLTAFGVV